MSRQRDDAGGYRGICIAGHLLDVTKGAPNASNVVWRSPEDSVVSVDKGAADL